MFHWLPNITDMVWLIAVLEMAYCSGIKSIRFSRFKVLFHCHDFSPLVKGISGFERRE